MSGLFDTIYGITEETKKVLLKPTVKRGLQRKFNAAYDDAENKKIEALNTIQKLESSVETFDINDFMTAKNRIINLERQQTWIKEEYFKFFDKEMTVSED